MKRLFLFIAIAAAAIVFPLAQTQTDVFQRIRVGSGNPAPADYRVYVIAADTGSTNYGIVVQDSALNNLFYARNDGLVGLSKTGGSVSNPSRYNSATQQPGFHAYHSIDVVYGAGTTSPMALDTESYDNASNFASNIFTAPVAGQYLLCGTMTYTTSVANTVALILSAAGQTYELHNDQTPASAVRQGGGACAIVAMAVSDTARLQVNTSAGSVTVVNGALIRSTHFSGRLLP
jgi:hypothetical protein